MDHFKTIHKTKLFSHIPMETLLLDYQEGRVLIKTYAKDTVLHAFGQPCTSLDLLLEGALRIDKYDLEGRLIHITDLKQHAMLGGNLLFASPSTYPFTLTTKEATTVAVFNKDLMITYLQNNKLFLEAYLSDLSGKAQHLTAKIHTLTEKTLKEKILFSLTTMATQPTEGQYVLNMTKKAWAEQLGVARTSLSRALKDLQDDGILTLKGKDIHLLK